MSEQHPIQHAHNFKDITGQRFNRLTAIRIAGHGHDGRLLWLVLCDCGKMCKADTAALTGNHKKSCGCLRRSKNGTTRTPMYSIWKKMHSRCSDPSDQAYPDYGGRGIYVCERWATFENFRADMGIRPAGLSIERKDNSLGYSPDNCKWASPTEQARNRRSNTIISFRGESLPLCAWGDRVGIKASIISRRLIKGWPIDSAMSLTPDRSKRFFRDAKKFPNRSRQSDEQLADPKCDLS